MACPRARAHALVGKCPRFGVGANKEMGDRDLVALARERLARKDTAVEVNIDEI